MNRLPFIVFGAVIGLMGGFSFGMVIFPWLADQIMPNLPRMFYLNVARMGLPLSLLWIPGGALAAYWGGARRGALLMGLSGLIAGGIYAAVVAPGSHFAPLVGLAAGAGLLYGGGAGLLIGGGLPSAEMIPPKK
ncbi:MAG: hypothetical protein KDD92_12015 [Caldilineaceae bacterium]|nr:hypothetical protein [Caldilineaceae bacterium]